MEDMTGGHPAVCILADAEQGSVLVDLDLPITRKVTLADGTVHWEGIAGATAWGIAGAESGGDHGGWHVSTMPGLSITLAGAWEIEAANGDRRVLEPGMVLVMLDSTGPGHRSRPLRQPCVTMGVGLDATAEAQLRALVATMKSGTVNG